MSNGITDCKHLDDFLTAQVKNVQRHIRNQPWFDNIKNKRDFLDNYMKEYIQLYGEVNREWYCGFICPDRHNCEEAQKYLKPIGGVFNGD